MVALMVIVAVIAIVVGVNNLRGGKNREQGEKMLGLAVVLFLVAFAIAPSDDEKESVAKEDEQQTEEAAAKEVAPTPVPVEEEPEEVPYDPDDYTKYWTELFSMHEGLRYNMSYIVSENYSDGNENFNWFYENNTERTASVVVASRVDAPAKGFDVEAYSKNGGSFSLDIDGYYDVIFFYDDDTIERVPLTDFVLKD